MRWESEPKLGSEKEIEEERYLLLDYDGTLHNTLPIYAPAFRKAYRYLICLGEVPVREFSDEEIGSWLGYNSREMWLSFQPDLSEERRQECSALIGREMLRGIREGQACLYPGALEALRTLCADGIRSVFLSNCKHEYMEAHRIRFGLDRYFTDFYCCEDYDFRPKTEIFAEILREHPGRWAAVGDRHHDLEVGKMYDLPTIGCLYGFARPGELAEADLLCEDVRDLPAFVREIFAPSSCISGPSDV